MPERLDPAAAELPRCPSSVIVLVAVLVITMGMGMLVAIIMGMVVFVVVLMVMMRVSTTGTMHMRCLLVIMRRVMMAMIMVGMPATGTVHVSGLIAMGLAMGLAMRMVMIAMGMAMIIGTALWLEGAHHLAQRAALPAHHHGQDMVMGDVDCIRRDLGRRVPVADMPGHGEKTQRVFRADFHQVLGCSSNADQATILQLERVAIIEHRCLVQIEQDFRATIAFQRDAAAVAVLMVERDGIDDQGRLDGRAAGDGGGAQHGDVPWKLCTCQLERHGDDCKTGIGIKGVIRGYGDLTIPSV